MSKFNDLIYGDTPVLLDLYANWCGPCKVLSPIIKEIKSDGSTLVTYADTSNVAVGTM